MSSNVPGQPEYLGPAGPTTEPAARSGGGRRTGIVAAAAVAVVAAVGVGAYGVVQLMAGGSSPASAVPSNALGYVSLDLDPSAAQKIEAVKILRKFPAITSELELSSRDDLRRTIFDEIVQENDCEALDYEKDVAPWIGDRVAVAALPDSKDVALPVVLLQVTDEAKAEQGVDKLAACGSGSDSGSESGVAFSGDYLVLAEKQSVADKAAASAEEASLEDDEDFATWMERTGEPGIVTMYAAKSAADAVAEAQAESGSEAESEQLQAAFADFEGAAGVVRFEDGAVEAEFSTGGLAKGLGGEGADGPSAATLPETTAAVLAVALQDGWLDDFMENIEKVVGEQDLEDAFAEAEEQTGLSLPEDIETLLGDGFSISVDADIDFEALRSSADPSQVPAGIRIQGDPDEITPVIDKLKQAAGPQADIVTVKTGEGVVVVGLNEDYAEQLTEEGGLGSVASFEDVVPEAGSASGLFFVNFDAGDGFAEQVADLLGAGDEAKENIAPLDALGLSGWVDDDEVQHALIRLSTD